MLKTLVKLKEKHQSKYKHATAQGVNKIRRNVRADEMPQLFATDKAVNHCRQAYDNICSRKANTPHDAALGYGILHNGKQCTHDNIRRRGNRIAEISVVLVG